MSMSTPLLLPSEVHIFTFIRQQGSNTNKQNKKMSKRQNTHTHIHLRITCISISA